MALSPKFAGHRLLLSSSPNRTVHTVELFLDYVCPFSAKQFATLYNSVDKLKKQSYASNVQFIFRHQIQPWHPSSTLVHEAGLAVLRIAPDKFWTFSQKLFEKQTDYFDVNVVHEERNDTYKRLAKLAASVGVDEGKMVQLLHVGDKPDKDGAMNIGNEITNDLKQVVKMARQMSIHVSPTVVFNGVPEPSIQSSFTEDQWAEWLEKNCSS